MEGKVQAKIAADVEVKARGWSWSWSWNGSWIWSWELAGAPEMAAGASPPTHLEKYGLTPPQNPDFGPKWRFGLQTPPFRFRIWGGFGPCIKTRKWDIRPRRPAIQLTGVTQRFPLKVDFQGTLDPESASAPPHFHRFPSY